MSTDTLTADEKALCRNYGVTEAEFLAAKNDGQTALTREEQKICQASGVTEAEFLAERARLAAERG